MDFATDSKIKDSDTAELCGDHIEHLFCLAKQQAYLECEMKQKVQSSCHENLDALVKKMDETDSKLANLKHKLKTAQNKEFLASHFEERQNCRSVKAEKEEDEDQPSHKFQVTESDTILKDIIGNKEVVTMIKERIQFGIDHPECTENFGSKYSPKSVLVYGLSGIGKTMLAEGLANELSYNFVKVMPANIKDKYVGNSEKNVKRAFDFVNENLPAVLFWDEIDTVLSRNEGGTEVISDGILGTLLDCLNDQLKRKDLDLIVMGATNCPKFLPDNLLRRFMIKGFMAKPDEKERSHFISHLLKKEFLKCTFSKDNLDELAKASEHFSYADITDGIGNSLATTLSNAIVNNSFKKCKNPMGEEIFIPSSEGGIEYSNVPKNKLRILQPPVEDIVGEFNTMTKASTLTQDSKLIDFNAKHGTKPSPRKNKNM